MSAITTSGRTRPSFAQRVAANRDACEAGYPAWVPEGLRPARGVLVGLAIASVFWIVIILAVVIL